MSIWKIIVCVAIIFVVLIAVAIRRKRKAQRNSIMNYAYPNRTYGEIYEFAYCTAKRFLESLPGYKGNDTEILAALYEIGRVTVGWVDGNLEEYAKQAEDYAVSILGEKKKREFRSRAQFYWIISHGGRIAGLWSLSDIPPSVQQVPMLRCAVALGDCITNPEMINDYEDAPLLVNDIFSMSSFQKQFAGDSSTSFFSLVRTYCALLAGKEFTPPILKEYEK